MRQAFTCKLSLNRTEGQHFQAPKVPILIITTVRNFHLHSTVLITAKQCVCAITFSSSTFPTVAKEDLFAVQTDAKIKKNVKAIWLKAVRKNKASSVNHKTQLAEIEKWA